MRQFFLLLAALLPFLASSYVLVSSSRPAALSSAYSTLHGSSASQVLSDVCFGADERTRGSMEMMRHGNRLNRLGKPADQRKALLRALTTEVIRHGRIKTTLIRAKVVRKWVDKMISLSKRGTLHARRQALAWVYDKDLVAALFEQAPERYADRNGGYCRVLRTTNRKGDNAKMGIIELV